MSWKPIVTAAVALVVALSIVVFAAMTERGVHNEYNRTVGLDMLERVIWLAGGVDQIAACRCIATKEIRLEQNNGLGTVASLYDRGRPGPRPGAILIHGNTWMGRNLATYRVLASRLAERGWIVLTYDQLGFGESDDPFSLGPAGVREAWDRAQMAEAALEYLLENTAVDRTDVTIIGHSGGSITALKIGLTAKEIGRIVLIAPPRRIARDNEVDQRREYFRRRFRETRRFVYGKPVPAWFSSDMTEKGGPWYLDDYVGPITAPGHKPVMFVVGQREKERHKESLEQIYETLAHPKRFVRLHNSDHYGNVAQSLGWVLYDTAVMAQLVGEIEAWRESRGLDRR